MNTRGSFLILVALVAVVVLVAFRGGADEPVTNCRGTFEATMHRESGTGLALGGEYVMTVEGSGAVAGALTLEDGDIVPFVGQAQGRAISLAFDLGDEREVFGVGAAEQPLHEECGGEFGGPFTGPGSGTLGDWHAASSEASVDSGH
ncbi:MAG: hypothetical protein M3392_05855 [Actinomycetota bacterium]|nr:hypothetical protein [Actinomycetota bacterium]